MYIDISDARRLVDHFWVGSETNDDSARRRRDYKTETDDGREDRLHGKLSKIVKVKSRHEKEIGHFQLIVDRVSCVTTITIFMPDQLPRNLQCRIRRPKEKKNNRSKTATQPKQYL
jgi:hypothetical protein